MITEQLLRKKERWIRLLTGLKPAEFWTLFQAIEQDFPAYERERRSRPDRKRAVGAGRPYAHPLLIRVLACLCYLRLHLTQETTAELFRMHQSDISRDLRRLLPLIQRYLPLPVLLPLEAESASLEELRTALQAFLEELEALLDTTEQPIRRPKDPEKQREFYSGKKKRHTVKTQVVTNRQGQVVAITPAVAGKTADIEIARRSRIVDVFPEDTQVYDDKAYIGLEKEVPSKAGPSPAAGDGGAEGLPPRITLHTPTRKPRGGELSPEEKERNRQINRVRVGVEHVIGHMKNWRILSERFRCALEIYTEVFRTIGGLRNFQRRFQRGMA